MTDKEFIEYLVEKLRDVDDTCGRCKYNPSPASGDVCLCEDISTCADGMRKYAEEL